LSRLFLVDLPDELVEDGGAFGLAVFLGVVALALEGGPELDGGLEVAAGSAGGFHPAVELDGAGAQSVAEHAGVCFAAQFFHAGGLVVGGQFQLLAVERVDFSLMAWYSSATTRSAMRA
jgi:hypothetical protein